MKSTKIWLAIAGILLVVLGIFCIAKPTATLFTTAWLIGLLTLFALMGINKFETKVEDFRQKIGIDEQ